MQYILTQEEYDALKNTQSNIIKLQKDKLQKLCTQIANTMPIEVSWREEISPWECILSVNEEWYCDECPVRDICPNQNKAWSK